MTCSAAATSSLSNSCIQWHPLHTDDVLPTAIDLTVEGLRAYPNNPAALRAMSAQEKCRKVLSFSGYLSHRTRMRRKRIRHPSLRSTTQRRAYELCALDSMAFADADNNCGYER